MLAATKALKALAPAVLLQFVALPSLAQANAQQQPATPQDLYLYAYMGAISTCISTTQNIADFDNSIGVATGMVESIIFAKNKSQITDASGKVVTLEREQLSNGSFVQVLGIADTLCGGSLKGKNKEQFDKLKASVQEKLKNVQSSPKK